jgi:type IV pilus assembly protein PilF
MTAMKTSNLLLVALLGLSILTGGCTIGEAARKKATYHYQMGLSYLGENNVTGALVELTEAEKLDPDNPELLNSLGLALYRKNKFVLSEQKYLRALELKPTYSEVRNNLGVDYLELKRWDEAIAQLKIVTDDIFYSNQESALINLGLAYFGKGDYPKALAILHGVVNSDSSNPRAMVNLGKVYLAMEKTESAIVEFSRALKLNKEYANAHYYLGLAYLQAKDKKNAAASFREVLRIAPDSEIGQLSRDNLDQLK